MPTKIEWAEESWNPVTGCTPISEGCQNCYARRIAYRLRGRHGYPADEPFRVTFHPDRLEEPLRWRKPRRAFVCSMGDLFHEDVPASYISDIFRVMERYSQHIFLLLTKRPQRMKQLLNGVVTGWEPEHRKHIWLGVTAENQARADERIPVLLQIPAAVRFVSVEPMLGPVDLSLYLHDRGCPAVADDEGDLVLYDYGICVCDAKVQRINWVICGGESGPGARPLHPDWVRGLRDQCNAAGVPFFFKQWGEWAAVHKQSYYVELFRLQDNQQVAKARRGGHYLFTRVGKKAAGRLLDGREWNEYPEKGN